jgi:hypothetical protein
METTNQEPQLLKKRDAARLLSISPRTLDDWVAKGIVPYLAISPRLHLFDMGQVRAALAEKFGVRTRRAQAAAG